MMARSSALYSSRTFPRHSCVRRLSVAAPLDAAIANEETFGPVVVVEVVGYAGRCDCRRQSHHVRPHVFDSRREYVQGIRHGAQDSRRNRECEFTNRQRRDSRAEGWGRTGPQSRRFQRRDLDQFPQRSASVSLLKSRRGLETSREVAQQDPLRRSCLVKPNTPESPIAILDGPLQVRALPRNRG
jgi:hypothetical protein